MLDVFSYLLILIRKRSERRLDQMKKNHQNIWNCICFVWLIFGFIECPNKRHYYHICSYLIWLLSNFLDTAKESRYWKLLPSAAHAAHHFCGMEDKNKGRKLIPSNSSLWFYYLNMNCEVLWNLFLEFRWFITTSVINLN